MLLPSRIKIHLSIINVKTENTYYIYKPLCKNNFLHENEFRLILIVLEIKIITIHRIILIQPQKMFSQLISKSIFSMLYLQNGPIFIRLTSYETQEAVWHYSCCFILLRQKIQNTSYSLFSVRYTVDIVSYNEIQTRTRFPSNKRHSPILRCPLYIKSKKEIILIMRCFFDNDVLQ